MTDELTHYGTPRHSGRYPWGSGGVDQSSPQRSKSFLDYIRDLFRKGMSEKEVAEGMGMTTTQLRAEQSIAKNQVRKSEQSEAVRLKDKGMSTSAIARQMGKNESSVRALLDPAAQDRSDIIFQTAETLKKNISKDRYLDIGSGTENYLGVSKTRLNTAIAVLEKEGYKRQYVKVEQLGNPGKYTSVKVLTEPNTPYSEVYKNQDRIKTVSNYSEDGGRTFLGIEKPKSISSSRVAIRYAEDGGATKDGVIELRRGVDDISLGKARYAQVRIAVNDTHYIKGMAMYSDDLPKGVDVRFNTNKTSTGDKLDALKPLKSDIDNPFGSTVRQKHYIDKDGKKQLSTLNIVGSEDQEGKKFPGEEGGWEQWSKTLSSQMLSKQNPALAKKQLDLTYTSKQAEFDEIKSLTNPAVKKKLLESFADDADSSSVHLKAAALPRTMNHVLLPINSLKDNEIYAPRYRNGETVVLIRHPHGGIFEIPELVVNNRNKEANSVIKGAADAVGINSKVAHRLSGADFDGDTALVIPNNPTTGPIKTASPLAGLKDFDPQIYKVDGPPTITSRAKQQKMGDVSNLITDMTIQYATQSEIARAVRHSMVVIDSEKHNLNYKQSYIDNGIASLKEKYQGKANAGAATLISRANSRQDVLKRTPRRAAEGGPIDPATGKRMYTPTGETYVDKNGVAVPKIEKSKKMRETDDAFTLSSGTVMEAVYATHANKLKSLANEARKEYLGTPNAVYSPSANKTYKKEVDSLNAKLNLALKNAPLERNAQLLGNTVLSAKRAANPNMTAEEVKKIKGQALSEARTRVGAKKAQIVITPSEWQAIQAGAISNSKLNDILKNADLDQVKKLATPKSSVGLSSSKLARAKSMLASGYTQAEVADALGVSVSTLSSSLK